MKDCLSLFTGKHHIIDNACPADFFGFNEFLQAVIAPYFGPDFLEGLAFPFFQSETGEFFSFGITLNKTQGLVVLLLEN